MLGLFGIALSKHRAEKNGNTWKNVKCTCMSIFRFAFQIIFCTLRFPSMSFSLIFSLPTCYKNNSWHNISEFLRSERSRVNLYNFHFFLLGPAASLQLACLIAGAIFFARMTLRRSASRGFQTEFPRCFEEALFVVSPLDSEGAKECDFKSFLTRS